MAKRRSSSAGSNNQQSINRFDKGLNTDIQDYHLDKQSWISARNAINNSHIGDLGDIGNEPANEFCSSAPYKIIGAIHLSQTEWWIFSTNDQGGSEIGIFNEGNCTYEKIVNDTCLNFRSTHPISGASRSTWNCSNKVYWQDNLNPDRTLDRNDVPWVQECTDSNGEEPGGCITCIDTDVLDCDKLRLEIFMGIPCARIERGPAGGSMLNGSYYVQVAYVVNSQRVTDYFPKSNVLHLFEHDEPDASIDVFIDDLDKENFDEFELVLIQQIGNKLSTKKIGNYSTNQDKVTIDLVDPTAESIPPNDLLITNPIADKSEGIFSVGKYLFRTGITGKFDFNYQPLANQITTKWQVVQYPDKYYRKGGSNVGYMRDEVYSFFIRFRYRTGDYSNSYHIPGRTTQFYQIPDTATQLLENDDYTTVEPNNIEQQQGGVSKVFQMFNTANGSAVNIPLDDGGVVVAEGEMGYWESDEFYPDKSPEVWNASYHTWSATGDPAHDLCGERIRHHKFPENSLYEGFSKNNITNHFVNNQTVIQVMGVAFDNIQPPVDNDGNPIPNIVGYEILRGSRNGNRTVLFKGMINNMRTYQLPEELDINRTGLYPNYPYNDVTRPDLFNSTEEVSFETLFGNSAATAFPYDNATNPNKYLNYYPNYGLSRKHFTFHSPDTNFYKPFLSQKELKIYGNIYGKAPASYLEVDEHPKHVFITDVSFYMGLVFGIGLAIAKAVGKKTKVHTKPGYYRMPLLDGGVTGVYTYTDIQSELNAGTAGLAISGLDQASDGVEEANVQFLNFGSAIAGFDLNEEAHTINQNTQHSSNTQGSGMITGGAEYIYSEKSSIPPLIAAIEASAAFLTNIGEGADLTYSIIQNAAKTRQFAIKYQSHCDYPNFRATETPNRRRIINEAVYLRGHLQNFLTTHVINNLLRIKTVAFDIDDLDSNGDLVPGAFVQDTFVNDTTMNRIRVSDIGSSAFDGFSRRASSHYVAFKTRLRSQYGQVDTVQQLQATDCVIPLEETSTGTIFGGDTYIGRYQEKNTFYHFYRWLYQQPDRAEFNYHLYDTVQHTVFWMDTDPFNVMEFVNSIGSALQNALQNGGGVQQFFTDLVTPSDKHCMDCLNSVSNAAASGLFTKRNCYVYLFHSSVRDFFVESDINIDMRDWDDQDEQKQHWDILQDLRTMFATRNIRAGNYYKIDRSLSVDYLPFSKVSWGKMQDREYNPYDAEKCFTVLPRRLQYSLPQQTMLKRDNWSAFLGNNYRDFSSEISTIKGIRDTGILLLFKNQGPGLYPGVDELQLKSGTSITVGDGGLFAREMQRITNSDKEFEYGSCQSRLGAIATPVGTFFISQNQGKIFLVGSGLKEITLSNNQHWFNQYLPYQLLLDFPDYDLTDNTIAGIGCQAVYDNEWGIVYFTKRDFRIKPEYKELTEYIGEGEFLVDKITRIKTGDLRYFNDASWTISYDPKSQQEISWHDWHPNLCLSGTNTFLTIKDDGIWRHNKRCDKYCNYYGVDYPFEIEFANDSLPMIATVKNVEYFMQVFEFEENCRDRFHVLDFNFDEAVVYNSEQVSGLLKLNLAPKNDIRTLKSYPIVGLNQIDIVYSKEEHRYRFNQFWDITDDRGEFSPTVTETIWITEPNGYIKNLNPINLDYSKNELQRKKFRHNNNRILLRRTVSGNKKMLLMMNNTKLQNSSR
jgi:hypothetical protein